MSDQTREQWEHERAETVQKLRAICAEFGDNNWPDDLHLADVLEKHLLRNLWRAERERQLDAKGDALDRGL